MRRRVTFSRNLTLSLSRTCRCYCKYCAFATHQAHLHEPEEVERLLDGAARRSVKELLVLTGEAPEVTPGVARAARRARLRGLHRLRRLGVRAGARARPAAAHEPRRARPRRPRAAARGDRLAGADARVASNPDLVAHQGSPTKHPARRLETIRAAGELKIPFTSGILVGIGESEEDRDGVARGARRAAEPAIQEVILQNFVPHRRYYGEEPAEIADRRAPSATGAPGLGDAPHARRCPTGPARSTIEDMKRLIAETRRLMPDVGIQIPPNLADWWPRARAPRARPTSAACRANGDHISPEHPFPSPHQVRKRLQRDGVALTERLCVYPQYIDRGVDRARACST